MDHACQGHWYSKTQSRLLLLERYYNSSLFLFTLGGVTGFRLVSLNAFPLFALLVESPRKTSGSRLLFMGADRSTFGSGIPDFCIRKSEMWILIKNVLCCKYCESEVKLTRIYSLMFIRSKQDKSPAKDYDLARERRKKGRKRKKKEKRKKKRKKKNGGGGGGGTVAWCM